MKEERKIIMKRVVELHDIIDSVAIRLGRDGELPEDLKKPFKLLEG